jgi:hypothetical protein
MRQPDKVARLLLALVVGSCIFADYWEYSRQYHGNPGIWMDVVQGTAAAPQQYRVGVVKLADFITRHAHLGLRHGLTLIDLFSAAIVALLLYGLFERGEAYRRATVPVRWFGAAAFLFLMQFYLSWVTWYERPETLPSTLMLTLTLALASASFWPVRASSSAVRAGGILLVAALQGFIRADVIFAMHVGLLLACLSGSDGFALGRKLQAATSGLAILIAGGIQGYLMHVVYPLATYGKTEVLEIRQNLMNFRGVPAFVIFMVPWLWVAYLTLKRREMPDRPNLGLLLGSAIYLAMWFTVGRIEEVRIFMPYAITLIPLTVVYAMRSFAGEELHPRKVSFGECS